VGSDDGEVSEPYRRLLDDHPRLKVLALEGDGRSGSIWELRPHRIPLGELSPRRLVQAINEVHRT
jgi:hypothetical protein